MASIWDPITICRMHLPQRITMSPMTRSRALDDGTPAPLAVTYYAQRASLGMLVTVAPVAKWALANPDFIERLRTSAPLNDPDPATFYTGGAHGYTDYPTLTEASEEAS